MSWLVKKTTRGEQHFHARHGFWYLVETDRHCDQEGHCLSCGRPWRKTTGYHVTNYDPSSGCFPLCEGCWSELSPADRLPFYWKLWVQWMQFRDFGTENDLEKWRRIKRAVEEGR